MKIDYSYHYRKWHNDTPEHAAALTAYYQSLLGPHLPSDRSARILDVGCGMGYCLYALKQMDYTAIEGIDMDEAQVASCHAKRLNVVRVEDSVNFLRKHAATYRLILALDVIEHVAVSEQIDFTAAICEATQPGGQFICTVPNANSVVAGRYRHIDWTHTSSFTEHSLDFVLHHGGFRSISIAELEKVPRRPRFWWLPVSGSRHWWALRLFRWFRRLELMAELGPAQGKAVPLSPNLFAVARKL